MSLTDFRTLGRSGLVVSPLALGTMTFGTQRWGSSDEVSKAVFDAYIGAGGNFIDTADVYASGRSEEMLGGFRRWACLEKQKLPKRTASLIFIHIAASDWGGANTKVTNSAKFAKTNSLS